MAASQQPAALDTAANVFKKLDELLKNAKATDQTSDSVLQQLHDLTKSPNGPRFAQNMQQDDIQLLCRYAFHHELPKSHVTALRCLNNVLVLTPSAMNLFLNTEPLTEATNLMKSTSIDDQFLATRLLLVCFSSASTQLLPLLQDGRLAGAINANILNYKATSKLDQAGTATIQLLAVAVAKYEEQIPHFLESISPILEIFNNTPIPSPPLETPMSPLIDALAILLNHADSGSHWHNQPRFDEKLAQILEFAMAVYAPDIEERITPLISLLYSIARDAPAKVMEHLQKALLPSDKDRTKVLGQGDSLPHRVVKLSTEATTMALKALLAQLLLRLSDGDPQRLIHNVGFGCAVGLLQVLGIPVPSSNTDDSANADPRVNPITGQRVNTEAQTVLPEMTREEKEREAERLFVLFERLKATGVVDVENPVHAAARSGQIEELDSDADD